MKYNFLSVTTNYGLNVTKSDLCSEASASEKFRTFRRPSRVSKTSCPI